MGHPLDSHHQSGTAGRLRVAPDSAGLSCAERPPGLPSSEGLGSSSTQRQTGSDCTINGRRSDGTVRGARRVSLSGLPNRPRKVIAKEFSMGFNRGRQMPGPYEVEMTRELTEEVLATARA